LGTKVKKNWNEMNKAGLSQTGESVKNSEAEGKKRMKN